MSVRSGAAVSMPGMMDTILNLGLNDDSVAGLARDRQRAFAFDSYRRLIQMYGEVVDGIDGHRFEQALGDLKHERGVQQDVDLDADDLARLVETFKEIYEQETGDEFPQDAREQLRRAVIAVFESWDNPRAQVYRRTYAIPDDLGTAVNVVQMVFGNKGERSATGVCFTRDPSTGEPASTASTSSTRRARTSSPASARRSRSSRCARSCRRRTSSCSTRWRGSSSTTATCRTSSSPSRSGGCTCCRRGRRSAPQRRARGAVDMVGEGLISREEAITRIDPGQLDQLLHPMLDPDAKFEVAARGLNASPGAACGRIVLDADTAEERGKAGEAVILVRCETTPGRHPRADPGAGACSPRTAA